MEHATAEHRPYVLVWLFLHPESEVLVELALQTLGNVARRHKLAVFSEEWRVVDSEHHRHCRLVDCDALQWFRVDRISHSVADFKALDTDKRADVATLHAFHLAASHTLECVKLLDALAHHRAVLLAKANLHALAQFAAMHTTNCDTSYIRRVVERRDEHLRSALEHLRSWNIFDDGVEQRDDVVGRFFPIVAHPVLLCRAIDCREVELFFGCIEVEHQVKHHLVDLVRTAVRLVNLIDYDNRFQPHLDGFLKHETRLRHRALESVDEQQASVSHIEHALHLTTEVGVSRSVDNIDFVTVVVD